MSAIMSMNHSHQHNMSVILDLKGDNNNNIPSVISQVGSVEGRIYTDSNNNMSVPLPPSNFCAVENNYIYRSGFSNPSNSCFLQSFNLRSIIYLCPEPYPEENLEFLRIDNIKLYQFGIDGTKESSSMSSEIIMDALRVIVEVRNQPVLVHCKRGKHRTGCLVGCLRKLQNWCLAAVVEEYKHFAGAKWEKLT